MAAISPDILRQVKRIELRTRGLVNSRFVGEYHSVFKGQGMEFSEVREYQPGDEVRAIDWNVSARMRRLFVKRYVEERELTVLLVVDCSGSSRFGTGERDKQSLAAELAAVLALTATRNNDRVGLLLCSDRVEHVVPPRKGRRHALRLVRDVLAWPTTDRGTDLARHRHGDGVQALGPVEQQPGNARVRGIGGDAQMPIAHLHRDMPIAQVIGDPGQRARPLGAHMKQLLGGCANPQRLACDDFALFGFRRRERRFRCDRLRPQNTRGNKQDRTSSDDQFSHGKNLLVRPLSTSHPRLSPSPVFPRTPLREPLKAP